MNTLKSLLLSTSLLMTVPFAAADVQRAVLSGEQAQSSEVEKTIKAFEDYQTKTAETMKRLLTRDAQVELSTLRLHDNSSMYDLTIGVRDTLRDLKAKEQRLTAETTSLETQLATAMGEKNELEKKLEHTKAVLTQLEQSNRQAGEHSLAKIRELTDALQKAKEEYNKLYNGRSVAADARAKELEAQLAAQQKEVERLTAERDAANAALATQQEEVERLTAQLAAQQKEVARLTGELAAQQKEVARLTAELKKAKEDAVAEARRHADEINRYKDTVTDRELESKGNFANWTAAEARVKDLKAQLAQQTEAYNSNDREVDDEREAMKAQAEAVRQSLLAEKGELQIALNAANARVKELEAQLAAKGGEVDNTQLIAANEKLTTAEARVTELEAALKKANAELGEETNSKRGALTSLQNRESELREAKAQLAAFEARERELRGALENEKKNSAGIINNHEGCIKGLSAANAKLAEDFAKRELELKDANEAHARELTAANEAHARELEEARTELDKIRPELISLRAAKNQFLEIHSKQNDLREVCSKQSAQLRERERELEKAKTDLSTQAHYFSVENEMLRKKLEALRSALANNGQATADANQPLSDERRAAAEAAAAILEALEGRDLSQRSQSDVAFSDRQSVGSLVGNGRNAGAPQTLAEVSSLESSPAKTPAKQGTSQARQGTSQARQDTSQAPATPPRQSIYDRASGLPPFNPDDSDNRSPSQLPASPPAAVGTVEGANTTQLQMEPASPAEPAVATGEDPRATQIARLQADLAAAQAIVDKPDLEVVPVPGRNARQQTKDRHSLYIKDKAQLDIDKAAAKAKVERLTAELAALQPAQPAQPAGN